LYSNSKTQGAGVLQSVYWLSCWLESWWVVIPFPIGTRKVSLLHCMVPWR